MRFESNGTSINQHKTEKIRTASSEKFHRENIVLLEKKLLDNPKCAESLAEWISSYHQLSDLYLGKGELESAQKCLLIPHHSMLYMVQNSNGDDDIELIATKAISMTLPALMEFAKTYPPCEHCMNELRAQQRID